MQCIALGVEVRLVDGFPPRDGERRLVGGVFEGGVAGPLGASPPASPLAIRGDSKSGKGDVW